METLYREIQKVNRTIRKEREASPETTEAKSREVYEAICLVEKLAQIGRKEGLLGLEDYDYVSKDGEELVPLGTYLKEMMLHICDGQDPEDLPKLNWCRYFADDLDGYQGLIYIIYLEAASAIQQQGNPYGIKRNMITLLSSEMAKEFEVYDEIKMEEAAAQRKLDVVEIAKEYRRDMPLFRIHEGEEAYESTRLLEQVVMKLSDLAIQRILREVDFGVLGVSLIVLEKKAGARFLDNLPDSVIASISERTEDVSVYPPQLLPEVEKTNRHILGIIQRLYEAGELGE